MAATALPLASALVAPSETEGDAKAWLTAERAALAEMGDPLGMYGAIQNLSLAFSVSASALTIAVKTRAGLNPSAFDPVSAAMRSATLATGDFTARNIIAALSLVVPSTATLGHSSGVAGRLYHYFIDNAGTLEPAVSSKYFGPNGIVTTTPIAAASNSATTMYSTTGRASVPFICIGRTIDTQTVAGTWAAVPTSSELWPFDLFADAVALAGNATVGGTLVVAGTSTVAAVNASGAISVPDGTAASPSLKVGDEQNGLYSSAANALAVALGGVSRSTFRLAGTDLVHDLLGSAGSSTFLLFGNATDGIVEHQASSTGNYSLNHNGIVAGVFQSVRSGAVSNTLVLQAGGIKWGTGTASFGQVSKRKTADESVTSSTTLQDDDHLTFAIAANEEWVADFNLYVGASLTTTGIKVAVSVPAGATLEMDVDVSATAGAVRYARGSSVGFTTTLFSAGNNDAIVRLSVWVLNGVNAGSVTLQFAQETSVGTAVTLRKGSHMLAARVA